MTASQEYPCKACGQMVDTSQRYYRLEVIRTKHMWADYTCYVILCIECGEKEARRWDSA